MTKLINYLYMMLITGSHGHSANKIITELGSQALILIQGSKFF